MAPTASKSILSREIDRWTRWHRSLILLRRAVCSLTLSGCIREPHVLGNTARVRKPRCVDKIIRELHFHWVKVKWRTWDESVLTPIKMKLYCVQSNSTDLDQECFPFLPHLNAPSKRQRKTSNLSFQFPRCKGAQILSMMQFSDVRPEM
jgi:hypothetical protein